MNIMSCFTEVDETKNFYAFRVRSPKLFIQQSFRTPQWARRVAESVVTGAYVTMGIISKTGKWATQSIKVPLAGRTTKQARRLAMQIAAKLKACPEALAMNREKACSDPIPWYSMKPERRQQVRAEMEREASRRESEENLKRKLVTRDD